LYLKSLEIVGFKSFAQKTKLDFEPGMTAIVGPNGCGKSNISDAIRWVLGEQSAKALRGAKMEDVIFNGTDAQKALSMAEVSLTLADCEAALGTEYDEVTVTRRVLRSGEGQYFINKTPCRLKDIHRLFMDTGIGTNSYSLMEQGRIDLILSSRPEDRRAVFEEASGITKFKADKKEAIRKLEQTEANLLRLADIIREVKRRIISLQRQAGKARRYKELQDELRGLDITLSRDRVEQLDAALQALAGRLEQVSGQEAAGREQIAGIEKRAHELRAVVQQKEEEIGAAMEAASRATAERDRAVQTIAVNRDRVQELDALSKRDSKDVDEAQQRLQGHEQTRVELATKWQQAKDEREQAEAAVAAATEALRSVEEDVERCRRALNQLRGESMDLEKRSSRLQNELSDLDAQERNGVLRRERLSAELGETKRAVEKFESRRSETEAHMQQLREAVQAQEASIQEARQARQAVRDELVSERGRLNELQKQMAAREAQAQLVEQADEEADGLPAGARRLLGIDAEPLAQAVAVVGTLADHVQAQPGYQKALEAALRAWLDAVVLEDGAAVRQALGLLAEAEAGSARLLDASARGAAADGSAGATPEGARALVDVVDASESVRCLVTGLLAGVWVVDSLEQVPEQVVPGQVWVTTAGAAVSHAGTADWWAPGTQEANPMTRKHLLAQWRGELDGLREQAARIELALASLAEREAALNGSLQEAQTALEASRRELATCEGEYQVKADEARQAQERMETVSFELNTLVEQQSSSGDRRTGITTEMETVRQRQAEVRHQMNEQNMALQAAEERRSQALNEATDRRVLLSEKRQAVAQWAMQREDVEARVQELTALIEDRRRGLDSYQRRMQELQAGVADAEARLQPLEEEAQRQQQALAAARRDREEHTVSLRHIDSELHEQRSALEELRNQRSQVDVELAEQRLRRQNILDRLAQDYHLESDQLAGEPEPEWAEGERPDRETLETLVAEIRTKLESMGPVNLVAIEEHEELEERFQFLTTQQDDLVKAKTQLMEMIKKINNTTTEMFTRTFDAVNENFQQTFKQLFGGGSAKLVLVNDEEVLESGIEIIARPPGKKLQTVSLLSGGERTMTAVGLLFALYMVKPSPFCVLDELDAALDDANIGRFVTMVEGFVRRSQFIVITHNRQTIEAADALYGVTMEKFGISKIMSVRFHKHDENAEAEKKEIVDAALDPV
jgi:chromosome segregation protein